MLRTVLAPIALAIAACGGGSKSEPAGPVFSPVIANQLRAIGTECTLERRGETERRDCTGRYGTVQIDVGPGNRFTHLVIALPSKILPEAKGHIGSALQGVLGAQGVDTLLAKMSELTTGTRADLTIGNAKVGVSAGGKSTIAPEYTVELSWF
jgi:hypothetical protein